MNEKYTLQLNRVGDHLEVHIPELDITVTTAPGETSRNAAFDAAHLAIERWHLAQRGQQETLTSSR
jgi:hypothetical protein